MSLLVMSEILGLFVITLTADDGYSVRNEENLQQPIRIQSSKKQKVFSDIFVKSLKSTSNFEHLERKDEPHRLRISETMSKNFRFTIFFDSRHLKGSQTLLKSALKHFYQNV